MGCKISKNKYSDYEITTSQDSTYDLSLKLEEQFVCSKNISQKDPDVFEEITFEIFKQQKTLKRELIWIPYSEFNNILYHPISHSSNHNYSATWKNGKYSDLNGTNDWKVLLKELSKSSHMTQNDLKLFVAELECNRKKKYVEVYGISQSPITLNYIIVMDYLFSGN